jgi:DNA-binding SARP family transcriptional activator
VEFGLLGPLLVRVGESQVPVPAAKQRVLLASLLLRANQVVGLDEMADAVWGGALPGSARVTLQNYVKRLRQVLGPAGYQRIMTRPAGYLIEVEAGELDVTRFASLQADGRSAARAGDWDRASAQLGAALALWRGEPLADVSSRLLTQTEVPRLAETRLNALEARIDADLHLGRHRQVIAELEALTAAQPLRERLHELLMLALYQSGLPAAALGAYRRARRYLVEEVGIEPGPGLRDLSLRIQRSDAAAAVPLGRSRAAATKRPPRIAPRAARPAMLPAAVGFTGRLWELRALSALTSQPHPAALIAIAGTAGVGKTALAVHWARQHASRFPDGQLYVNLGGFGPAGPLSPAKALRGLLGALGVPATQVPAALGARQALFRSLTEGKHVIILLDNALDPAQVRPLLPATPTALILITSRNELTGLIAADGARPLTLGVLTFADARELLVRRLESCGTAVEPDVAGALVALCARLPMALANAAARAAGPPPSRLAELVLQLRDAGSRLDALDLGRGPDAAGVRAVFSWSYRRLGPASARMFRLLGVHPGPDITAPAAASLAGMSLPEARRLLRELARGHLVTEALPGRFACHDLLRAYAAEQARAIDAGAGVRAAAARALDHYLHTALAAGRRLSPAREPGDLDPPRPGVTPEPMADHQQALAWFEAEHRVLLAVVGLAGESGLGRYAEPISRAVAEIRRQPGPGDLIPRQLRPFAARRQDLAGLSHN